MQKNKSIRIGLVLPGGGARGAYQVGVLKAVAALMPSDSLNPFQVISGTSAGAVNASVIAANTNVFGNAINKLEDVWSNFQSNQVYKTDNLTMIKSSMHWLFSIVMKGYLFGNPKSLLDNSPLRELLVKHIRFSDIQKMIQIEFAVLGIFASLFGVVFSLIMSYGISWWFFENLWKWTWPTSLASILGVTALSVVVAWFATHRTLRSSPLNLLRSS